MGGGAGSPPTVHITRVASSDDEGDGVGLGTGAGASNLKAIPELQELESRHKAMSSSNVADPAYEKKSTKVYEYLVEEMEKADVNSEGKIE